MGIVRVGRYAEWKYLMTHDCVLKAKSEVGKNGVKAGLDFSLVDNQSEESNWVRLISVSSFLHTIGAIFPYAVRSILKQTFADFVEIDLVRHPVDDTPKAVFRAIHGCAIQIRSHPAAFFSLRMHGVRKVPCERQADRDAFRTTILWRTRLEHLSSEAEYHDADFLFSSVAEYRI